MIVLTGVNLGAYDGKSATDEHVEIDELLEAIMEAELSQVIEKGRYVIPQQQVAEGLTLGNPEALGLALDCTLEGFHSLVHIHVDAGRLDLHRII